MPETTTNHPSARRGASLASDLLGVELAELEEIAAYAADWDGNQAQAPAAGAILQARHLLGELPAAVGLESGDALRPWSIAPIPNGNILIEWRRPDGSSLDVEARPDGSCGYLLVIAKDSGTEYREREHVSHQEILALLAHLLQG